MKKMLAGLVLASSLVACGERTPQVITLQQPPHGEMAKPGAMTVSGSATLEVSPDCADMTLTLTAEAPRAGVAAAALTKKQTALIEAMKALGLETSDLKISHVSMNPVFRDWPHHSTVRHFHAAITITATTKKFELVAPMMEAAANSGATSMSTQFRRSDLPELKKKVREMALKAAKEKAELTAKTLGISLGGVTTVAEMPAGHMWHNAYFPSSVVNVSAEAATQQVASVLGGASQTLTLDITVGFELVKKA